MIARLWMIMVVLFCAHVSYAQYEAELSRKIVLKNRPGADVYEEVADWFDGETRFRSLSTNSKEGYITGKGVIYYENPVVYQGSPTFSRVFAEQTKGKIFYDISIHITDKVCEYEFSNFTHVPDDKIDNICFGQIKTSRQVPQDVFCDVDSVWCNEVWSDMKDQINKEVEKLIQSLPYYNLQ